MTYNDIKDYIETTWGEVDDFCIDEDEKVHALGVMPGSGQVGWYFVGRLSDIAIEVVR